MYFFFSWSSHQWFSYLCVLSPWWRQGSIGIFHFSVLAILRSIFRFCIEKLWLITVLLSIAVCGFTVFQHWSSVFGKTHSSGFSDLVFDLVFCFFCVLSLTSHSTDTVMIHVLIFSMNPCRTRQMQKLCSCYWFTMLDYVSAMLCSLLPMY